MSGFGVLAYDPMTGLAITPEEPDATAAPMVRPQGVLSKAINRLAGTQFGEPRMQTWPEKLVRSAATLPGDVVSGEQPMLPPGLRREDYTDAAPAARGAAEGVFGNTLFTPQSWQPNDPAYERAQDLAGMAGGGMMFGRLAPSTGEAAVAAMAPRPLAAPPRPAAALLADSATPGAPIAALEHTPKFYSGLERAVEAIPQARMTGEQWLGTLNNRGVKPEEMDWTGLRGFLAERGTEPVTKAQVVEHLGANKLELGAVHKGKTDIVTRPNPEEPHILEVYHPDDPTGEINGMWGEIIKEKDGRFAVNVPEIPRRSFATQAEAERHIADNSQLGSNTKFHDYQLPGGENYGEKLLTLPAKDVRAPLEREFMAKYGDGWSLHLTPDEVSRYQAAAKIDASPYKSSHWDEPNVLVHRRTNERDVNGQRSLHIEEIQSDWHQQGRKQGYREDQERRMADLVRQRDEMIQKTPERVDEINLLHDQIADLGRSDPGVPDAPFKKNWHELALKDAIREAAEKGLNRISWTPGEAQAARYDLSKQVDKISYAKSPDGTYSISARKGKDEILQKRGLSEKQLEETIGKEPTKKIVDNIGRDVGEPEGAGTLQGVDLKVGGEGMRGFYDKIIPDALNKIGKPHGVKVQSGEYVSPHYGSGRGMKIMQEQRHPVHYMDIPQSLKDQVLKKGFSLFEDAAAAGAPLAAAERESPASSYHALIDPPTEAPPAAAYHAMFGGK